MGNGRGIDRRTLVGGAAGAAGALLLGGCDRLAQSEQVMSVLARAEGLTVWVERLVTGRAALAREYTEADLSPEFKGNGTIDPDDDDYQALAGKGFAGWGLEVGGLVARPKRLSLADLRALRSRTQITRHDCVEGWSCIGKWKGAVLGDLLQEVGLRPQARYLVFYCADPI